jgi:integrase
MQSHPHLTPVEAQPAPRASSAAPSHRFGLAMSGRSEPDCCWSDACGDLALFNLAIDSKLRGCDLVALRIDDVAPNGYAIDRANVRQSKTGRPVRFELTEVTRQALDDYLRISGRKLGQMAIRRPRWARSAPDHTPVRSPC